MDIRKYFSPVGGSKPSKTPSSGKESKKKNRIIDSDEEDPVPSSSKKQRILASDSEDDLFEPKKVKKSPKVTKEEKHKKKSLPKPEPPKLKPTGVSDFFGSSPVFRKEAPTVAPKKVVETIDVHSDDDFEKTLQELDAAQNTHKPLSHNEKQNSKAKDSEKNKNKSKYDSKSVLLSEEKPKPNENSPPKVSEHKSGLASKLSAKIRENDRKDERRESSSVVTPHKEKKHREEKEKSHSEKKRKLGGDSDFDGKSDKTPDEHDAAHKKQKTSPHKEEKVKKEEYRIPKKEEYRIPKRENSGSAEKKIKEEPKVTPEKKEKHSTPLKEKHSTPLKEKDNIKKEKHTESKVKEDKSSSQEEENNDSTVEGTPDPEQKRMNARAAYFKFLKRSGPSNPGSKPIPEGAPECLQGLVFVITGVLESLDREESSELIKKYGGKVTTSVSRNTSYLIVGNEPGESKLKKAQQIGTKQLDEDGLLELIQTRPGKGDKETDKVKEKTSAGSKLKAFEKVSQSSTPTKSPISSPLSQSSSAKTSTQESSPKFSSKNLSASQSSPGSQDANSQSSSTSSPKTQPLSSQDLKDRSGETQMWVDKYKPANVKNIIGQQGEKSHVKKLLNWLRNWKKNQLGDRKLVRPSPWAKDDDGSFFKCALLSGPPGVGKTTTAHLVCKELGFDFVELNASDARSKRRLEEVVAELLSNKSLAGFAGSKGSTSSNHALVMDEVDGMSGNEDRGGVQELIALIKKSKIPIIAMCNDRNHPKIRSLANYCFDLRFNKPRIEQIRGPMMSVCFREGIKIKPDALDQIIMGANQDVRQILHHLSVWSANQKVLGAEDMKREAEKAKKNFKMGPWDVCKKVFTESEHKNMSIYDKSDLFFHDYSISPLFVQENYVKCVPHIAKGNRRMTLEQLSKTASSLADGDLCERAIRSRNAWSLLPVQAMYSSVLPGEYMSGHLAMQIEFPKWLGNNSRRNKFDRLMQELQMHMRLKVSGSKMDVNMDYCETLKNAVTRPLAKNGLDGVQSAVGIMNTYHLLREDVDSMLELTQWPGSKDPMKDVESKVKAAFTRAYNKEGHMTPFAAVTISKKKKGGGGGGGVGEDMYGEEEEELSEEEEDDITKNAMIKVKKGGGKKDGGAGSSGGKGRGGNTSSKGAGGSGRGRGRGKK